MKVNLLFGGKAGQGPNLLTELISKGLIAKGYYVFYSRDYQSLIRGGHNFNVLTFSEKPVNSNSSSIDLLVALDEETEKLHKKELVKNAIILKTGKSNMFDAGALFKILDLDFKLLEEELKKIKKRFEENLSDSKKGYASENRTINLPKMPKKKINFMNGNQAIAIGAIDSGLDVYYSYPMTPATGVLTELAQAQLDSKNKHLSVQLESEIAVINSAIGSAMVGAKSMCGTSGGGFDLMTESLSLAGMAEVPIVLYLSQRPGPSTGVATYTAQGDLKMALGCGHGEFSRVVIAPGDTKQSIEITNQAFYFSQKYRIPVIILGDKHLAESKYCFEDEPTIIKCPCSITKLERFNSYEKDSEGCGTEEPSIIIQNTRKRLVKQKSIEKETEKFQTFKTYGRKDSPNLILSWGSTKGAICDAIENLNCKFMQIIYLEPFSNAVKAEIKKAKNIIVVENNSTSPLSALISEKTGIFINDENKILRYDGRPFLSDELEKEIKRRLK